MDSHRREGVKGFDLYKMSTLLTAVNFAKSVEIESRTIVLKP